MPGLISVTAQAGIPENSDTLSNIFLSDVKFVSTWRASSSDFYLSHFPEKTLLPPFFGENHLTRGTALSEVSIPLYKLASVVFETGSKLIFSASLQDADNLIIEKSGPDGITISSSGAFNTLPADTCDSLGVCKKFFIYTDSSKKIISVSKNLLRLSGLREEEILGFTLTDFLTPEQRENFIKMLDSLNSSDSPLETDLTMKFREDLFSIQAGLVSFISHGGLTTGYKITGVIRTRPERPIFYPEPTPDGMLYSGNSNEGICILDDNDRVRIADPNFRKITGISESDVNPIRFTDIVSMRYLNKWYKSRINNKPAVIGINNLLNGKRKLLYISYRSRTGREYDFDGTILVITEFRSVIRKIKQHHSIFKNLDFDVPFGLALINSGGFITRANRFLGGITGYSPELLTDQPVTDLIYPEDVHIFMESFEKVNTSAASKMKIKIRLCSREGTFFWTEVFSSEVKTKSGKIKNHLLVIRDLSELHHLEQTLHQSRNLAEIGKMSAYLSHELKTPLSSIKMNVDLIKKKSGVIPEFKTSLNIVSREIDRLNNLLKDILLYSGVRQINPVKVNLRKKVEQLECLLSASFKNKKIRFINSAADISVKADSQKLQTLLVHLIDNAVEAIDENGEIEIITEISDDNKLNLKIRDSGRGISDPVKIFDPFYTSRSGGTGLGLPIAQSIADLHKWELSLLSSKPGETIFIIKMGNI